MGRDLWGNGWDVEGVAAVPSSVGAFGSLTSLILPDGLSLLPPSGCTAEMRAIEFFRYSCFSGAELAVGLDLTADAAEVAALLDFCSANPGMSHYYGTLICGSGTITNYAVGLGYDDDGNFLGYEDRAQWGSGDPCAGDGWYGVTCDAAGEHVTAMCALVLRCSAFRADPRSCVRRYLSNYEGVTAVPASVGAFGSLASLALPGGVTPLPASGCTAELAAIEFFRFRCLSGAERAAALSVTTDAAEVEALLDFCGANPRMSHYDGTPICGSGTMSRICTCTTTTWQCSGAAATRVPAPAGSA